MSTSTRLNSDFNEFAASLHRAESFSEMLTSCVGYFSSLGVTMMSYHHLPPLGAEDYDPQITVAAYGFPEDWVELYVAQELYRVDPIPKRALAGTEPFRWSETRSMPGLNAKELNYLDLMEKAHLGDGLAVPVFGPLGRNGYVGLGFGTDKIDDEQILQLQLAAQLGHQAYCDMLHTQAPQNIKLSPRESEILEWVARGKSNAVIAEILAISSNTVDTHLRRIYEKMNVSDRTTAALRGLALGLLG